MNAIFFKSRGFKDLKYYIGSLLAMTKTKSKTKTKKKTGVNIFLIWIFPSEDSQSLLGLLLTDLACHYRVTLWWRLVHSLWPWKSARRKSMYRPQKNYCSMYRFWEIQFISRQLMVHRSRSNDNQLPIYLAKCFCYSCIIQAWPNQTYFFFKLRHSLDPFGSWVVDSLQLRN